jgi:hypothetical protein
MMTIFKKLFSKPADDEGDYARIVRLISPMTGKIETLSQQVSATNKTISELTRSVIELTAQNAKFKIEEETRREETKPTDDDLRY